MRSSALCAGVALCFAVSALAAPPPAPEPSTEVTPKKKPAPKPKPKLKPERDGRKRPKKPAPPPLPTPAPAPHPQPDPPQGGIVAVRTPLSPRIDGRLEDEAWTRAPVFDAFVQSSPEEGRAPSERTELRVLYDDRSVYVGVQAFDRQPEKIVRLLGQRDNPPESDQITVVIDSTLDHRTGYAFTVNSAGVMKDGIYVNDTEFSADWDGVWEGRAAIGSDGWSAELAIPLRLLRLSGSAAQAWGFHVRRDLPRTHEQIDTSLIPRGSAQFVSRFMELRGMDGLDPRPSLELIPYLAARTTAAPQFADASRPVPRLMNPSADFGLDLRTSVTRGLSLAATVNPDFGQVEADAIELNLSSVELFFPEKRPFFTQGLDLFVPVGAEDGKSVHMLFYSRRIGLETPILAAGKLVGRANEKVELGVLDVVVAGAPNPSSVGAGATADGPPDRRVGFHLSRPLHLGPNNELPNGRPVTKNFFAAVARSHLGNDSRVGLLFADASPLSKSCYREDFASEAEFLAEDCDPEGGRAFGLDWDLRSGNRAWGIWGQLVGSQVSGSSRPRLLRDGTEIAPGDFGWGTYLRLGKLGGEPFRIFLQYEYASPRFELNHTGFLESQNVQSLWGEARYVRSARLGPFRDATAAVYAGADWTTDGRWLNRGNVAGLFTEALLPELGYTWIGAECKYEDGAYDIREIPEANIPYRKAPGVFCDFYLQSDTTRRVVWRLSGYRSQNLPRGALLARGGYGGDATLTLRPIPWLETQLVAVLGKSAFTARFLDRTDGGSLRFGGLVATELSLQLRQQVVLSPELTFEAFAQLFTAHGHHGPFYEADFVGRPIEMTDLRPSIGDASLYDFRESALTINAVLRWEYRLGSTLHAVYSRAQQSLPVTGVATSGPRGFSLVGLSRGPTTDTFLLKWSWFWDVGG
jgi:Domain of unknown function (DUF5916)